MAIVEIKDIEEAKALVGTTAGPCEWRDVSQSAIDDFARLSGDDQWIHVDVERAKTDSPYGVTIAHGNLTLSMIDGMRLELVSMSGAKMGVNYGWNRVRFPAPVPAGSRLRSTIEFVSVDEIGDGWYQQVTRFTVEVEGNEKPCCVAEHVGRVLV
jgi:acyl dehydratase